MDSGTGRAGSIPVGNAKLGEMRITPPQKLK